MQNKIVKNLGVHHILQTDINVRGKLKETLSQVFYSYLYINSIYIYIYINDNQLLTDA